MEFSPVYPRTCYDLNSIEAILRRVENDYFLIHLLRAIYDLPCLNIKIEFEIIDYWKLLSCKELIQKEQQYLEGKTIRFLKIRDGITVGTCLEMVPLYIYETFCYIST